MNYKVSLKNVDKEARLDSKIDSLGTIKNNNNKNSTALTYSVEKVLISPNKRKTSTNNAYLSNKYSSKDLSANENLQKSISYFKNEDKPNAFGDMEIHERVILPEEEVKIKAALAKHFLFQDLNEEAM